MTVTHLASPEVAAQTLRRTHDEMDSALMATVDVLGDLNAREYRINYDAFRHAVAARLREWSVEREWALLTLLGHEVTREGLVDAIDKLNALQDEDD